MKRLISILLCLAVSAFGQANLQLNPTTGQVKPAPPGGNPFLFNPGISLYETSSVGPALTLDRNGPVKARLQLQKSADATESHWSAFGLAVNATYDTSTGWAEENTARSKIVLNLEHEFYDNSNFWNQSELNFAAANRRLLNMYVRTQSSVTTVSSGSGVGGVTVTTADDHNLTTADTVRLDVSGTSPALAGNFSVIATPTTKTFTITPASALTGVSTASQRGTCWAVSGSHTVSRGSIYLGAQLSIEIPNYDNTDTTDNRILKLQGEPQNGNAPARLAIVNANASSNTGTEIIMSGATSKWRMACGWDERTTGNSTLNTLIFDNGISGGYGVIFLPKSGSESTTYVGINKATPTIELDVVGGMAASGSLTLGTASTTNGTIVLKNSANAFTTTLQTGVTGASYTLTLPTTDGNASQFLQTDGSGVLTWASPAGSGTVTATGSTEHWSPTEPSRRPPGI